MPFPPSRRKRHRSRVVAASLSLTSLLDIFVIILLFLLKSYSAEGDLLAADPNIKLPVSTSRQAPKMKLIVQVTKDDIIVDGKRVGSTSDSLKTKDLLITPLADTLEKHSKKTEFIARNNPDFKFRGEVLIQGDREIPFLLLEKIMFTCGQAGYSDISLAVVSSE